MEDIYFNPKTGYTGVQPLVKRAKASKMKTIKWLELQPSYTLHKPARRQYTRNKVLVSYIDEQWQADLVDLQSLSKYNDNYRYLLTCIDIFSKYAWAIPLKTKHSKNIIDAFDYIFMQGRKPEKIQSDAGTEFINAQFQKFLEKNNVNFFVTKSEMKASVVERFNRTLKERMWRYFTKNNTYRYIDIPDDLVFGYNNTKHTTIDIEPANVNADNEPKILERAFKIQKNEQNFKYNVGDRVRVSKVKGIFEKGYVPNWSEETFVVVKRINRNPHVYKIKDEMGEVLEGIFYEQEIQKVNFIDDIYIIEKVMKTRKRQGKYQYLVKWRGYTEKFNSWVDKVIKL